MANSSLSWCNQIIESLGKVPSFENEAVHPILEELCLHLRPSILAYPARIGLQTVNNLLVPQEAISYDIPLQRVLIEQLFLLEQVDRIEIQENHELLAQAELILSFSEQVSCAPFESGLDFLLFEHIGTGLPVLVRTCDECVSELSLLE